MPPILEVRNLSKNFPIEKGLFRAAGSVAAVRGVSFSIERGEILALVGESGSGKSTIGKMIQGLIEPSAGEILLEGRDARSLPREERARRVQMIFQDPFASLNPKLSVGAMLREALRRGGGSGRDSEVRDLLAAVGLPGGILPDYPHQFSGGQRQRLGIARALALRPQLILADEPVSALDLSIQAQILNLLLDLNERLGVAYLLITHDLSVVEQIADRVHVIHDGKTEEEGTVERIFGAPRADYTRKLLAAAPEAP